MRGCDGKLEKFEGDEFAYINEREELYPKYFGEDEEGLDQAKDSLN